MSLILTDIDDVLLHWAQGFIHHMGTTGIDITTAHIDWDNWINSNEYIRAENLIDRFNESEKFSELEPYEDAFDVVNRLHAQGYTFAAISAVEYTRESWAFRKQNLDKFFPDVFQSIFHVGLHRHSKKPMLSAFAPTFWIEDNAVNAADGADLGHTSIILDRAYNRNIEHPKVLRVNSWYEIEQLVTGVSQASSRPIPRRI